MSRVEHQIHDYFDAGVERISVEDVIAQAAVSETRIKPLKSQRNLRPAWAAVGAFAATIAALGGLAAVLSTAERFSGEFGSDAADVIQTDGGTVGLWLVAGLVAAVAAAAVTWMVRRRTKHEEPRVDDQGKVRVMETIEDTTASTAAEPSAPSRWPIVLIVLLAIAIVGLIAWMTFTMRPNSPNAAPPEIVQLMEDYTAAWNAHDADALEGLVTDSYRIHSSSDFDHDMESVRSYLFPLFDSWDWQVTNDGPYYAVTNGGYTWYVSSEGGVVNRSGADHVQGGLWTVVELDGAFRVAEHFFMGG
jgi:flagellar basal body-associated protein FliL